MTAVEWLALQMYKKMNLAGDGRLFDEIIDKAKEMQKQQSISFGNECIQKWNTGHVVLGKNFTEHLYNEYYKTNGNNSENCQMLQNDDQVPDVRKMVDKDEQKGILVELMEADAKDGLYSTITDQIDGIIFEMPFIEKMKLWELIDRLVNESKKELSDEEINKMSESITEIGLRRTYFQIGCREYREQLKKKQ